jgi:hypothetical protein
MPAVGGGNTLWPPPASSACWASGMIAGVCGIARGCVSAMWSGRNSERAGSLDKWPWSLPEARAGRHELEKRSPRLPKVAAANDGCSRSRTGTRKAGCPVGMARVLRQPRARHRHPPTFVGALGSIVFGIAVASRRHGRRLPELLASFVAGTPTGSSVKRSPRDPAPTCCGNPRESKRLIGTRFYYFTFLLVCQRTAMQLQTTCKAEHAKQQGSMLTYEFSRVPMTRRRTYL